MNPTARYTARPPAHKNTVPYVFTLTIPLLRSCCASHSLCEKDDWDDDDMDDDFCNQLRAELEKTRAGTAATAGQVKPKP